jgi:Fis family transcriptional regulator
VKKTDLHTQKTLLRECITSTLESYFRDMGSHKPRDLYSMVLKEVERPLLETVMHHVCDNQTKAAEMLGINRSTLRKKLTQYGLD